MTIIETIILGIVEGITEFLPISSTAHLILASRVLGCAQVEFLKSFEIIIQLGAILSVIVLYGKSLLRQPEVLKRVAVAFVPTAVIGFLLYKIIKNILFESVETILAALFLGGIALIVFERVYTEDRTPIDEVTKISYRTCVMIGLCQSLAVIPGVSRAAATIMGGLMFGIKRKAIVEFSFLLAIPTMLAATGFDMLKSAPSFSADQLLVLLVGFVTSFVVAMISIKFLLKFIQNNNFIPFGIYRMIIPAVWLLWHQIAVK